MAVQFTTAEACKALGISRRTFIRWTQRFPVEREVVFTESGKQYVYSRAALEFLMRQVRGDAALAAEMAQPDTEGTGGDTAQAAQGLQGVTCHPETDGDGVRQLALPPSPQMEEFMELLADVRDVVARAVGHEAEVGALRGEVNRLGDQVEQLAQVLAARLPGPPAAPAPPVRFRPRAVAEVVLLGFVGMLCVLLVGLVIWQARERGMLDQVVEWISR